MLPAHEDLEKPPGFWAGLTWRFTGAAPRNLGILNGGPDGFSLDLLRSTCPKETARIEALFVAAHRTFDARLRNQVLGQLVMAARQRADDPRLKSASDTEISKVQKELGAYADMALHDLEIDAEAAAMRGLNVGLGGGVVASIGILIVISLIGAAVLGRFAAHFVLGHVQNCHEEFALAHGIACVGGGAVGAVFSVIVRLRDSFATLRNIGAISKPDANGDKVPLPPTDPSQIARVMRKEGFYRVTVGWILAAAVFVLISSGLLTVLKMPAMPLDECTSFATLKPDQSPTLQSELVTLWLFWAGVGFLAGLNERWAFGLLQRGGRSRS